MKKVYVLYENYSTNEGFINSVCYKTLKAAKKAKQEIEKITFDVIVSIHEVILK